MPRPVIVAPTQAKPEEVARPMNRRPAMPEAVRSASQAILGPKAYRSAGVFGADISRANAGARGHTCWQGLWYGVCVDKHREH